MTYSQKNMHEPEREDVMDLVVVVDKPAGFGRVV